MNEDRPEIYTIPPNIADNGNVVRGQFKKQNAYEAIAIAAVGLILSVIILGFLPAIAKAIIFSVFALISLVALAGIKGGSLIETILEIIFFKRKKRIMKYKLPRKDIETKPKWKKNSAEQTAE